MWTLGYLVYGPKWEVPGSWRSTSYPSRKPRHGRVYRTRADEEWLRESSIRWTGRGGFCDSLNPLMLSMIGGYAEMRSDVPVSELRSVTRNRDFKSSMVGRKLERWMPFLYRASGCRLQDSIVTTSTCNRPAAHLL